MDSILHFSMYLLFSNKPIFETLLVIVRAKPIRQKRSLDFTKRGITLKHLQLFVKEKDKIARYVIKPGNSKRNGEQTSKILRIKLSV